MAATLSLRLGGGNALYGDRFRIDAPLGRGHSSQVFRSWDRKTEATIALKIILLPTWRSIEPIRTQFLADAPRYAALDHPGITPILDYGEADYQGDASLFLSMGLARGQTIERILFEEERISGDMAIQIVLQVIEALAYAHAQGIVHGDLKASHIILSDREAELSVKILDFDLARVAADESDALTVIDSLRDAPCHQPPEKLLSGQVDARTDVYAVGVLLYQLLSGRPPWPGTRLTEVLMAQLNEDPTPLSSHRGVEVSPALEALIGRCLAKDPEERPQNMEALAQALAGLDLEETPASHTEEAAEAPAPLAAPEHTDASRWPVWPFCIGLVAGFALAALVL